MPDSLLESLATHAEDAALLLARARVAIACSQERLVPACTASAAIVDAVQLVGQAVVEAEQIVLLAPAALARLQRSAAPRVRWDLADRPLRAKVVRR